MRETTPEAGLPDSLGIPRSPGREGREYRAYPSLARVRWLFPARGGGALRRAGIRELFRPSSPRGRALRAAISVGALPGEKVFLQEESLSRLEAELSRALGGAEPLVAFYVGTPGAYRKVTAQVLTPAGRTLAFAKIAAAPLARADVEAEHRVLLRLEEAEALRGSVPRALHRFDWQGSRVLLMTPGPARPGSADLTPAHLRFCKDLFAAFAEVLPFGESPMLARMSEKTRRVGPKLPGSLPVLTGRALDRLVEELGPVSLPVSMAHRDFAPFNTRLGPQGLFVFDWDHAEDGVTPLYDPFHFTAIQAALFGRKEAVPDRRLLGDLLGSLWPAGAGHLPELHLAYLLDMTLFYGEARVVAPDVGEGGMLDWFEGRLRAFFDEGPPV